MQLPVKRAVVQVARRDREAADEKDDADGEIADAPFCLDDPALPSNIGESPAADESPSAIIRDVVESLRLRKDDHNADSDEEPAKNKGRKRK